MNQIENASLRTVNPAAPVAVTAPFRFRTWLARVMDLAASPEAVWERILFYEEVPKRPARLLKMFLPPPVSTEGDKTKIGGLVHCLYEDGDLVKRITNLEPPRLMEFEVLEQHLRLAFDRAALAEMLDMFDWASQRRFGGHESDYVERFEKMDLPLLVVAGANDDLAPPASVRPGFTLSRSHDKTYRVLPLGHIDLLVGRDAPITTWTLVTKWLLRRTGGPLAPAPSLPRLPG